VISALELAVISAEIERRTGGRVRARRGMPPCPNDIDFVDNDNTLIAYVTPAGEFGCWDALSGGAASRDHKSLRLAAVACYAKIDEHVRAGA